jgi:hypothetical protein
MTSLIRVTDVDTNQIKPFMPSDHFYINTSCQCFIMKVVANTKLSGEGLLSS